MRLDSEAQRAQLLNLISSVELTVTAGTLQQTGATIFGLLKTIEDADLEPPVKDVVPIESLAPDSPDLKVERG